MSQQFVVWCRLNATHYERIEAYDPDDAARKFAQIMSEHHHQRLRVRVLFRGEPLFIAMRDSFGKHHDRTVRMKMVPEFIVTEEK